MKALFIVALHNLKLQGRFGRGLHLSDTHFLTNDNAHICSLLSPNFEPVAGVIEANAIRIAPAVIYSITEHDPAAFTQEEARQYLDRQLGLIQQFLMALWLVKDNAVNFELGFLDHPYRESFGSFVHSNFRAIRFTDARGAHPESVFTESEIRAARDLYVNLFAKNAMLAEIRDVGQVFPMDYTRLDRVLYFAQAARCSPDLGVKISFYVTCFESLFCTDSAELAHKLSERLAFFCGDSPEKRFDIFKTAKTAYTVRSKTVHGDKVSKKLAEEVPGVAQSCDSLLRRTLRKIFDNPDLYNLFVGSPQDLEEYLTQLVFGIQNEPAAT